MDRPFPAYNGDEPYVFVSYAHSDTSAVYPELVWLKDSGVNIWYDEGIEAGTEWTEALAGAIQEAKLFLYFVTPDSVQSQNCRNEVNYAAEQSLPIIAVHLKKTDLPRGLSLTLSSRQAILKHEIPIEDYQQKLQSRISTYLNQTIVGPKIVEKSYRWSIFAGAGVVLTFMLALFFYLPQDTTRSKEAATQQSATSTASSRSVDLSEEFAIRVGSFADPSDSDRTQAAARKLTELVAAGLTGHDHTWGIVSLPFDLKVISLAGEPQTENKRKAGYVLRGNLQPNANLTRLTIRLVRAEDGSHVWTNSYDIDSLDDFEPLGNVTQIVSGNTYFHLFFDFLERNASEFDVFRGVKSDALAFYFKAFRAGDASLRRRLFEKAVKADPQFGQAVLALSGQLPLESGLARTEIFAAAVSANDRAIELSGKTASNLRARGNIFLNLGFNYAEATTAFEECLAIDPESLWCDYGLARIALREGRVEEALRRMTTGASIFSSSDNPAFVLYHAIMLVQTGRSREAVTMLESSPRLKESSLLKQGYLLVQLMALIQLEETARVEALIIANPSLASSPIITNDLDALLKLIEAVIAGRQPERNFIIDGLRLSSFLFAYQVKDDPRFVELLDLLDSLEIHTEQYMRDQDIEQKVEL